MSPKEHKIDIDVCITPISGVVDGDKIQYWLDNRNSTETSFKDFLDLIVDRCFETMIQFKNHSNGGVYPVYVATLYAGGGMSFISPVDFSTDEVKSSFFNCLSDIIYDIAEKHEDKPIASIVVSEAWSCGIRKDKETIIKEYISSHGREKEFKNTCDVLISNAVARSGSIADIPDDHEYIKKFEVFSVMANFLSMDGPVILSKIKLIDPKVSDEVVEGILEVVNKYSIMAKNVGRIQFDLSEYEPINFDEKEFENE